jgi:uncharacterized protein YkwD
MLNGKFSVKIVMSLLIVSLIATSFGGAFATAAFAADLGEETSAVESGAKADKAVVGGLLALGLFFALKGGGKSSSSSDSAKTTPGQPASTQSAPTPSVSTQPTPSQTVSNQPNASVSTSSSGLTAEEQKAFSLMNADRAASGLPALKINTKLVSLARTYAQDMMNRNYFSHYNPEGQSPFDRMSQAGIRYQYAGENLAINTGVEAAEKAFMNSPGHRANILSPNYSEIGIGVRRSGSSVYVVQEFIKP